MFNSRKLISSLSLKIFFGFWLMALIAITSTRWISSQFRDVEKVRALPVQKQQPFIKAKNRLIKQTANNKVPLSKQINPKNKRLPKEIWIKSMQNKEIFTNSAFAKPDIFKHVNEHAFETPVILRIRGYELAGPFKLNLRNRDYQMFFGKQIKNKDMAGLWTGMPLEIRVLTAVVVTGILAWILSWYITRPLNRLTQASNHFGKGQLHTRVVSIANRNDEVGQLAKAFNQMAERIQSTLTSQQRLLGDVSHELRSPLTRLQLALSLAQKVDNKPAELEKYFQRFDLELDRLEQMIAQALRLSKLENDLQQLNATVTDIGTLIENIISDNAISIEQKKLSVTYLPNTKISLDVDVMLLRSAIENLVTNAIRYSPKESEITIELSREKDEISISVADQGDGVSSEHLEDIFKPFYRTSLARDRVSGGTGLGLAIASKAVTAHGGRISAKPANEDSEKPGLIVTIVLPILNT
ncbi:ATP-binding protein [Thalassotalea crassostreae]|uniref:ATP-binding protein n=1 Tax=Thalassotalea crassostreae TaxID=1763536 RepID=UPI000838E3F4|nr:ATP-binding protein [Thalassotalea crassostreae]